MVMDPVRNVLTSLGLWLPYSFSNGTKLKTPDAYIIFLETQHDMKDWSSDVVNVLEMNFDTGALVSVHCRQGKYQLRTNCCIKWNPVTNAGSQGKSAATLYCAECPKLPAMTHPSKQIGTCRMVTHIWHHSETIVGRNDPPLGCSHTRGTVNMKVA